MKINFLLIGIAAILFAIILLPTSAILSSEVSKSTTCYIATPSDLDNRDQENPMGILRCYDNKTGSVWEREIDVMAAGLWRSVVELVTDETRGRLFAWSPIKKGGPGWRIFDLDSLEPIEPDTPLRELEGIEPRLMLAGEYLVLFHHDSSYYDEPGRSRMLETTFVFSADDLSLLGQKQGISGRIDDDVYPAESGGHFYAVSTWDDRDFPVILSYSLPDLKLMDSFDSKDVCGEESRLLRVADINNDRVLLISYLNRPGSAEDRSEAQLLLVDLKSHSVGGKPIPVELNILAAAKASQDGLSIFCQDGKSNSLSIYDSSSGSLLDTIRDVAPGALKNRSYLDESVLFIVNADYSAYRVIDGATATVVEEISINTVDEE